MVDWEYRDRSHFPLKGRGLARDGTRNERPISRYAKVGI